MGDLKRKAGEDAPAKANKKKRKSKYNAEDESLDMELGLNTLIARLDSQLLADYLAQKTSRFGTDLSPVEISDLTISGLSVAINHSVFGLLTLMYSYVHTRRYWLRWRENLGKVARISRVLLS